MLWLKNSIYHEHSSLKQAVLTKLFRSYANIETMTKRVN